MKQEPEKPQPCDVTGKPCRIGWVKGIRRCLDCEHIIR